jgi:hypothetical protein
MMSGILIAVNVILLFAVFFLWKKRANGASAQRDKNLARLEEVIRCAELTNSGFFRSLELVQQNLGALLTRAEDAERRLRVLMLQPGNDKKDQFAAAALLLSEGQQPDRVAAMLKLPLPQVETVQALQKMTGGEKIAARKKRDDRAESKEIQSQKKNAALREKIAARPSLTAGGVEKNSVGTGLTPTHRSRIVGVTA